MNRRKFLYSAIAAAATVSAERASAGVLSQLKRQVKPTRLMNYTVLSSNAILKAWSDNQFRSLLLAEPDQAIAGYWDTETAGVNFKIHENSAAVRHLPLPARENMAAEMSKEELSSQLEYETGSDETLEYFLPAKVIARALVSKNFKRRLLKAPDLAIKEMGYDPGEKIIVVHQNTPHLSHLALPESPASFSQLASMERHIINVANTTKCCASGTCDSCSTHCHTRPPRPDAGSTRDGKSPGRGGAAGKPGQLFTQPRDAKRNLRTPRVR